MKKNATIFLVIALVLVALFSIYLIGHIYSEKEVSSSNIALSGSQTIVRFVDEERDFTSTSAPTTPKITTSEIAFVKATQFENSQTEVDSKLFWLNTSRFEQENGL